MLIYLKDKRFVKKKIQPRRRTSFSVVPRAARRIIQKFLKNNKAYVSPVNSPLTANFLSPARFSATSNEKLQASISATSTLQTPENFTATATLEPPVTFSAISTAKLESSISATSTEPPLEIIGMPTLEHLLNFPTTSIWPSQEDAPVIPISQPAVCTTSILPSSTSFSATSTRRPSATTSIGTSVDKSGCVRQTNIYNLPVSQTPSNIFTMPMFQPSSSPTTSTRPSASMSIDSSMPKSSCMHSGTAKHAEVTRHTQSRINSPPLHELLQHVAASIPDIAASLPALDTDHQGMPTYRSRDLSSMTSARSHKHKRKSLQRQTILLDASAFTCHICSFVALDPRQLAIHVKEHTGSKPFKCLYCAYTCLQAKTYKRHLEEKHPGMEGFYLCALCNFKSICSSKYIQHMADDYHRRNVQPTDNMQL